MHEHDHTMQAAALGGWLAAVLNALPVTLTLIALTFSIVYYGLKIYGDPTTQKIIAWIKSSRPRTPAPPTDGASGS